MTKVLNLMKRKLFGAATGVLMVFAAATIAATWFFTTVEEGGIHTAWHSFEQGPATKAIILTDMRASLGFGGMIHDFKNYVLRMDAGRLERIEARFAEAAVAIETYEAHGVNARERAALADLSGVIAQYATAVTVAREMAADGYSPTEIDAVVKIDDAPALNAIATLDAMNLASRRASMTAVHGSVDAVVFYARAGMAVLGGLLFALFLGLVWFMRGQAGMRKVQAALRANEERLSGIMENVGDAIVTAGEDGAIETFNRAAERIFGYGAAEIVGKDLSVLMPEPENSRHGDFMAAYLTTGQAKMLGLGPREVVGVDRNGAPVDLELAVNEMVLGGERKFIAVMRDISERLRVRHALNKSQERLQAILDNTPAIIWVKDENDRYELVNDEFVNRLGLARDQVIGKTEFDIFPKETAKIFSAHTQRVRTTCEAQVAEEPVLQVDGPHTRLSVQFPLEVRDGKPLAICGISTDITKRMRDEQALREGKLHLSHAQRIARLGHWVWDESDQRVIYSSEELARVFGVSRAAFPTTAEGWAAFIHPDDRESVMATIGPAVADKTGYEIEYRIVRDDGEIRWIRVLTEAELDEAGRFVRMLGTAQDITERKAGEDALQAKTATVELLQAVAVAANEATNVDDALQTCLDEICAHIGWPVGHVFMVDENDSPDLAPTTIWHLDDPGAYREFKRITEDIRFTCGVGLPGRVWQSGEPEWASDISKDENFPRAMVLEELNVRSGFAFPLLVGRDVVAVLEFYSPAETGRDPQVLEVMAHIGAQLGRVVERKRSEEALRAAKEQAELASRSKSDFLANMSHELRTPLNAIIGFSEMISTGLFGPVGNPKYVEYSSDIKASGEHLLELINDILDLSKIEAGRLELHEEEIDVRRIVETCLIFVKERAKSNGVELSSEVPDDVPVLFADDRKIKQILLNLLSNAVKFTPAGGAVTVRVGIDGRGGLNIEVIDTGIGIALKDIPKALALFGQVDSSLNRKYEGTGLGLPLSEALARLHGGSLTLNSSSATGTTVTLVLPPERLLGAAEDGKSEERRGIA